MAAKNRNTKTAGKAQVTVRERRAIKMLRRLDPRQREKFIESMGSQLVANATIKRIAGLRRLQIVENRTVDKAFGVPPTWRFYETKKTA